MNKFERLIDLIVEGEQKASEIEGVYARAMIIADYLLEHGVDVQKESEEITMTWNVFYHNCNTDKIESFNIFKHGRFREDVQKNLKIHTDKDEFAKALKSDLQYYFWSKAEYEIIISALVGGKAETKIDIYQQVMLNLDRFVDYVWSFKEQQTFQSQFY